MVIMDINIGDEVICVDNIPYSRNDELLNIGDKYTVLNINDFYIRLVNDNGRFIHFKSNFKTLTEIRDNIIDKILCETR